jgi:hypothetical protein
MSYFFGDFHHGLHIRGAAVVIQKKLFLLLNGEAPFPSKRSQIVPYAQDRLLSAEKPLLKTLFAQGIIEITGRYELGQAHGTRRGSVNFQRIDFLLANDIEKTFQFLISPFGPPSGPSFYPFSR